MRTAIIIGSYPPEEKRRRVAMVEAHTVPGMEVGVIDAEPSPYKPGLNADSVRAAAPAFVEACRQAERAGYDAVVPLGVLDIGLEEARAAVDIPVVGAFGACLRLGAFLGRRLGVVAYNEGLLPILRDLSNRYDASASVVAYDHVGVELPDLAAAAPELEGRFCSAATRLKEAGAEVIICAGISLCPLHLERRRLESLVDGPVIEPVGAPLQVASALVQLRLKHVSRWIPPRLSSP